MKNAITIDEALVILNRAKEQIGGDKALILCLCGSGIEDANVENLNIIDEGVNNSRYIEVHVDHPSIQFDEEEPIVVTWEADDSDESKAGLLKMLKEAQATGGHVAKITDTTFEKITENNLTGGKFVFFAE